MSNSEKHFNSTAPSSMLEDEEYNKLIIKIGSYGVPLRDIESEIISTVHRQNEEDLKASKEILKIGKYAIENKSGAKGASIEFKRDIGALTKGRQQSLKEYHNDFITVIWKHLGGNRTKTARQLGTAFTTVRECIKAATEDGNLTFYPAEPEIDIDTINIEEASIKLARSSLHIRDIRAGIYLATIRKNGGNVEKTNNELDIGSISAAKYKAPREDISDFFPLFCSLVKDDTSTLDEYTTKIVRDVVDYNSGNKTKAAKQLKCTRALLYRYFKKPAHKTANAKTAAAAETHDADVEELGTEEYNKLIVKIGSYGIPLYGTEFNGIETEIISAVYRQNKGNIWATRKILEIDPSTINKRKSGIEGDNTEFKRYIEVLTKGRRQSLKEYRRDFITVTCRHLERNRTKTAKQLGIGIRTVQAYIKEAIENGNSDLVFHQAATATGISDDKKATLKPENKVPATPVKKKIKTDTKAPQNAEKPESSSLKQEVTITKLFDKSANPVMNMKLKDIMASIIQSHDDEPWKTSSYFSIGLERIERYNRRLPIDNFEPLKPVFNMMGHTGLPLNQLGAKIVYSIVEQTGSKQKAKSQLGVSEGILDKFLNLYDKKKEVIERTLTGPA